MTWQPIETAPRDGTRILALMEDVMIEAWWDDCYDEWSAVIVSSHGCGCCSRENDEPTHWMPLPAKPFN